MKSWLVNPRLPLNTRIWGEIAAELCAHTLQSGACALGTYKYPDGTVRVNLLPDDNLTETSSDDS